jgi:hypothetical protein
VSAKDRLRRANNREVRTRSADGRAPSSRRSHSRWSISDRARTSLRRSGLPCESCSCSDPGFDFVQGLSVSGARERWGRRWPELVGLLQHKGVTLAHCVKTAGEKVGGVGR